ncbi:MAG TPA: biopolymer transporter ExbD [Gemmatimonadetes bacterium]|jgi:biopolymer transport protein ExbD|nr:biopolymer transporter ExbD [Gemmatimonadota bacterium]
MAVLDKKKSKVSDKVPSSSMADIAFLLLIFFLVTTTFPKDKGLAIVLPEEGGEVQVSAQNILHIIIQPNGLVEVKRGDSQQVQVVAARDIEGIWRQDVSENDNLIAAVKTHPQAPYRFMVDVLDALHTAGAERISLQLFEG